MRKFNKLGTSKYLIFNLVLITFLSCTTSETPHSDKEKEMLINNCLLQVSHSPSISIDFDDKFIIDTNLGFKSFNNLFEEKKIKKMLVFRYDTKSCDLCLEQEIKHLSRLNKNPNSFMLLISTNNINEFKIIRQKYKNIANIYSLKQGEQIYSGVEGAFLPYYFLADRQKGKMLFIPNKNLPYLSEAYLNYVFTNDTI